MKRGWISCWPRGVDQTLCAALPMGCSSPVGRPPHTPCARACSSDSFERETGMRRTRLDCVPPSAAWKTGCSTMLGDSTALDHDRHSVHDVVGEAR